ncbi:MAG TPA: TonB-dependent receptor, partial [Gemmatimonadaceae bacterium]|nr:TonB-dependent receptor [Gemmatimonadaceae bacterium]
GNLIGRKSLQVGRTTSRLTAGVDASYQDGAILFYTLSATQGRGTTLADNKGEGAQNVGAFLQDELTVTDRLSLLLGARWDQVSYQYRSFMANAPVPKDSRQFSRVSPRLGVNLRVGAAHALYANVGGGIEVPAGNETDPTPGAGPALLNPLLDPIRTTSYEAGIKSVATTFGPLAVGYDVEVTNDVIPYNAGRYYLTAGRSRRTGVEVGAQLNTTAGIFGNLAATFSRNRYLEYVVDSAVIFPNDPTKAGKIADYGGNEVTGIPPIVVNAELGAGIPGLSALRVRAGVEHSSKYFADDANRVRVPGYTIGTAGLELRDAIPLGPVGLRGFVSVRNLTDRHYIGSAFLNPDLVNGAPAAYEPGMPRTVTVSVSLRKR